jgi:hypothetical protein
MADEPKITRVSADDPRIGKGETDWEAVRAAGDYEGEPDEDEFEIDWSKARMVGPELHIPAQRCAECNCDHGGVYCNWFSATPGEYMAEVERLRAALTAAEGELRLMKSALKDQGGIARKAIARAEAAEAQLAERDAAVAAAYEAAARVCNDRGVAEQVNYGLGRETQNYYRARDAIRALTPSDALAALERVKAEARREGRVAGLREAAYIYAGGVWYHNPDVPVAILARAAEVEGEP